MVEAVILWTAFMLAVFGFYIKWRESLRAGRLLRAEVARDWVRDKAQVAERSVTQEQRNRGALADLLFATTLVLHAVSVIWISSKGETRVAILLSLLLGAFLLGSRWQPRLRRVVASCIRPFGGGAFSLASDEERYSIGSLLAALTALGSLAAFCTTQYA